MKKTVSFILSVMMVLGLFTTALATPFVPSEDFGTAVGDSIEAVTIKNTVENFLGEYNAEVWNGHDSDLTANTAAAIADAAPYALGIDSVDRAALTTYQDNISYVQEKADYFREIRETDGLAHSEPQYRYEYHDVTIDGNKATTSFTECVWFYYEGMDVETFIETEYEIELLEVDGQWLITNVTDNTWFDDVYKGTNFSASEAILEKNLSADTYAASSQVVSRAPTRPSANTLDYNHESAAGYAFTYTRDSDISMSAQDYYNKMFPQYASGGGDCMNFASQCVWAGFSADQTVASIDALKFPMDASGSYTWYSYSRSTGGKTLSWAGTLSFPAYIKNSNQSATEIGLKADYISLGKNEDFSTLTRMGYSLSDIKGAICILDFDSDGKGDHGIVLTNVTGTARKNILYCGHTQNVKAASLGDFSCPMAVIIPQYFYTGSSTANEARYTMLRPVGRNTTAYLQCSYQATQSWVTVKVVAPSGNVKEQTFNRTSACNYTYVPTEIGYHTVTYSSPNGTKTCYFYAY